MPPRARALPPSERRASLVDSALALIRERGAVPSTKEIAEAAGVAEGTIFRAFDTKEDLVDEVIAATFCPAPLIRQLQEVDVTLALRERLVATVDLLQQRFFDVFDLMVGLRLSAPPMGGGNDHHACTSEAGHVPTPRAKGPHACAEAPSHRDLDRGRATQAVIALIEPDAELLRCTPEELARYLRLLTFAGSHRAIADGGVLTPETIVDVVLNGVVKPQPPPPPGWPGRPGIPTPRPTSSTRTRKAH